MNKIRVSIDCSDCVNMGGNTIGVCMELSKATCAFSQLLHSLYLNLSGGRGRGVCIGLNWFQSISVINHMLLNSIVKVILNQL